MSNASLPIAVQLYSLRNLKIPLADLLAQVAAIGYSGVELLADHGVSADELRALLTKTGLKAVSAHAPITALETNLESVVAYQKTVGNTTIVIPYLAEPDRPQSGAGWQQLGGRLDRIGKQCKAAGVRLLYHNHAFEMMEVEGRRAIDWLLAGATPEQVGFEIDLAWVQRGGANGVKMLQQYKGRCACIHCKDLAPEGQGQDEMGFADVGHGVLDWNALLPAAKAAGVEWYIVEHDLPKDPIASIRRSFEFLRTRVG